MLQHSRDNDPTHPIHLPIIIRSSYICIYFVRQRGERNRVGKPSNSSIRVVVAGKIKMRKKRETERESELRVFTWNDPYEVEAIAADIPLAPRKSNASNRSNFWRVQATARSFRNLMQTRSRGRRCDRRSTRSFQKSPDIKAELDKSECTFSRSPRENFTRLLVKNVIRALIIARTLPTDYAVRTLGTPCASPRLTN